MFVKGKKSDNFKNINVPLPIDFYDFFIKKEASLGFASHLSFFQHLLEEPKDLFVDVLEVDGVPGIKASATIQVGHIVYSFTAGRFAEIGQRDMQPLNTGVTA